MTNHRSKTRNAPRLSATAFGLIGAALLAMTITVVLVSRSDDEKPGTVWQSAPTSPYGAQLAQLNQLRKEITGLDKDMNHYDEVARQQPNDDQPLNDMESARQKCQQRNNQYEEVAAVVPGDLLREQGLPEHLGGVDLYSDCDVNAQLASSVPSTGPSGSGS